MIAMTKSAARAMKVCFLLPELSICNFKYNVTNLNDNTSLFFMLTIPAFIPLMPHCYHGFLIRRGRVVIFADLKYINYRSF